MGPKAGLDGRKISSPPGFDPGPSSPYSVAVRTELPGKRWRIFPLFIRMSMQEHYHVACMIFTYFADIRHEVAIINFPSIIPILRKFCGI